MKYQTMHKRSSTFLTMITLCSASTLSLISVSALADGYIGVHYGSLHSEDADMGNLGFSAGYRLTDSIGVEAQLTQTLNEDNLGYGATLSSDTQALYATYQSTGEFYFKAKAGLAKIDYNLESDWYDASGSGTGLSFGLGMGVVIGDMARLELEFTQMPELEKFGGEPMNASGNLMSIGIALDI